uniref:Clavesin-1-like n=1 Tax=Diabrotica virgifera virgifera TaxID=50390 RepID=A0A6P7GRF7_DIAVI
MSSTNLLITDRNEIRKNYGKTEKDVLKDIDIIKEWLKTQKHLPEIPTNNMIEFFLTNNKFSIEKTKKNLDMYYTIYSLIPEMYRNVHPCKSDLEAAYNTGTAAFIPTLTPSKHRITVFRYENVDSANADITRIFAHVLKNMYEIRIQEDLAMGEIFVIDCKNLKLDIVLKITPIVLKQVAFIFENVQSFRLQAIHYYNTPGYFHSTITLLKSLLSKKLSERVYSHKTIDDLTKFIPLDLLPSDYGGKQKSVNELAELWKQKMFEYKDRFDQLESMKVNEELRPEKLQNDELLGYYGNFKKIDTD